MRKERECPKANWNLSVCIFIAKGCRKDEIWLLVWKQRWDSILYLLCEVEGKNPCSRSQACTKNIFVDRSQIHCLWGWLWPLCKLSQQVWKWKKRMKKEWNNSNTIRAIIREGWLKFREWKMKGHKISAMLAIFTVGAIFFWILCPCSSVLNWLASTFP